MHQPQRPSQPEPCVFSRHLWRQGKPSEPLTCGALTEGRMKRRRDDLQTSPLWLCWERARRSSLVGPGWENGQTGRRVKRHPRSPPIIHSSIGWPHTAYSLNSRVFSFAIAKAITSSVPSDPVLAAMFYNSTLCYLCHVSETCIQIGILHFCVPYTKLLQGLFEAVLSRRTSEKQ